MYEGEKNEILYGGDFVKDAKRLPRYIQEKLADLLAIAVVDIFDLRLHTKRLAPPLTGKYSFRITRDWRVTFEFRGPHIIFLLAVDHRSKIYR